MTTKSERLRLRLLFFEGLSTTSDSKEEVQNIDLMILADFCRNCLSKWYVAEALDREALEVDYESAR